MRRYVWLAALVAGAGISRGSAVGQDGSQRTGFYPSRSEATRAGQEYITPDRLAPRSEEDQADGDRRGGFPQVRNYHQELFGGRRPTLRRSGSRPSIDDVAVPPDSPETAVPRPLAIDPYQGLLSRQGGGLTPRVEPAAFSAPFPPGSATESPNQPGSRSVLKAVFAEEAARSTANERAGAAQRTASLAAIEENPFSPEFTATDAVVPAEYRRLPGAQPSGIRRILASESEGDSPFHRPEVNDAARREPVVRSPFDDAPPSLAERTAETGPPDAEQNPFASPQSTTGLTAGSPSPSAAGTGMALSSLDRALGSAVSLPPSEGSSHTPVVTVRWNKLGDIIVGQPCRCELVVANTGTTPASDVVVEAHLPGTVRLTSAEPRPTEATTHLSWRIESLAAGAEQTIGLVLVPSQRGAMPLQALVRFTGAAQTSFSVDEPLLHVALRGPAQVLLGDPASQIILVSNPGTGAARNVVVQAVVPDGLEHPNGRELQMSIGDLSPGETRRVRLALAAARGGVHRLHVEAAGAGGLAHNTDADVTVVAPNLSVQLAGPSLRFKGRTASFQITVANDGTAPSHNVRVQHAVPRGFEFVSAGSDGSFDEHNRAIEWYIDQLPAGESKKLACELKAVELGEFQHQIVATSEQGLRTTAELATHIDGTASLVLEIVDLDDPVEVGVETGCEVLVRNDGSKAAMNVTVSCELPAGVQLIGARGAAAHFVRGSVVTFQPLAALEPGKTAVYRLHLRGTAEGHHRVRALLSSDSITNPLAVEELTRFYGE